MDRTKKLRRRKTTPFKQAMGEFNFGYILTAVLAFFFLLMGYFTIFDTGVVPEKSAVGFARQVIEIFTKYLGNWAFIVVAIAAFATMFSTSLTCHDGIAR